jgi:hypothetical protein
MKNSFMKKILILLLLVANIATTINLNAEETTSGNLTISPSIQEIEVKPGSSYDLAYSVENTSPTESVTADVTIETFIEGSVPGSTTVLPFKPDADYSKWIVSPTVEEFPAKTTTKKPIKLNIPNDAKSGAYFFAVVYKPKTDKTIDSPSKSNLLLQTRLANLIFVNIAGDSTKQPVINNLSTNLNLIDIFFDKLTSTFEVEVKGNSFYRSSGNAFLTDGDELTTLNSTISDSLILPGGKRIFYDCYENHLLKVFFVDMCKKENPSKLPYFGKKNLEVKLDYIDGNGSPQSSINSKQIIFFPYKLLLLLLFIAVLILVSRRYLRKKKYLKNKKNNQSE